MRSENRWHGPIMLPKSFHFGNSKLGTAPFQHSGARGLPTQQIFQYLVTSYRFKKMHVSASHGVLLLLWCRNALNSLTGRTSLSLFHTESLLQEIDLGQENSVWLTRNALNRSRPIQYTIVVVGGSNISITRGVLNTYWYNQKIIDTDGNFLYRLHPHYWRLVAANS